MSKLEDLLAEHTAEAQYEALSKMANDARGYVEHVLKTARQSTAYMAGAEMVLIFLMTRAEGYNPNPCPDEDE